MCLLNLPVVEDRPTYLNENTIYCSSIVYAIALKQQIRIIFIIDRKTGRHDILLSTDQSLVITEV